MVGVGTIRTKAKLNNMVMESRCLTSNVEGSLFFLAFFTLNGHFLVFFTCFVTAILCIIFVNPNRAESEHFSGKLRRKKRGSSFSLTPPLQPCSLLSYLSVAESPWLIIIGRCHHADDTQSALWISLAPLHTSALFLFCPFFSFLHSKARFAISIFQQVIIIHGAAYQYAQIGIIRKKVHVWLSFSLLLNKCRTISQPVKKSKTVFVWLQWTPMQISVATECSLLSSSLSSLSRLHTPAAPWVE